MNKKMFLESKKEILIIVGILILSIVIVCVFGAIYKQNEKERLAEIRNNQIEELIENFKKLYSDISFEMSYRTFEYDDTRVVYYIDIDENVEKYLKKTFLKVINGYGYGAFIEPLESYGVAEDISIRVNNEEIIDHRYGNRAADINWDWFGE